MTGANHGIGAATARGLAAAGCDVFVQYLRHRSPDEAGADQRVQDAAEVVRGISELGRRAGSLEMDLTLPSGIPALFDRIESDLGPVEILINNAAVSERDSFDPSEDALDWGGRPKVRISAETIDRNFAVIHGRSRS